MGSGGMRSHSVLCRLEGVQMNQKHLQNQGGDWDEKIHSFFSAYLNGTGTIGSGWPLSESSDEVSSSDLSSGLLPWMTVASCTRRRSSQSMILVMVLP